VTTVVTAGLAVLDFVFGVETGPTRGRNVFAASLSDVGGGPAANAAVTVAALGGHARFVGRVGDDTIGDRILADFARWGVDTSRVRKIAGVPSPLSAVVIEADGERTIVNYTDGDLFAPDDLVTVEDLKGADAVLADLRWPTGGLSALRAAADLGIPSVLEFDETPERGLTEALTLPSYVVFSAPALAAVVETADPDRRIEPGRGADGRLDCAHLGARGVLWLNDGVIEHTPAYTVTTVDTLGAGDVHHGAFALGVAENRPIEDVVKRPAAAAALKCARFGGRAGVPCTEEVDAFLGCRSADR
jgi:sulfofructose kinase